MFKYLVIKCKELGDQWECDADRKPICLTNDISKYGDFGYEIYEIKSNGEIGNIVKNYYDSTADIELVVFKYNDNDEDTQNNTDIDIIECRKIPNDNRNSIVEMPIFKKWCKKYLPEVDFEDAKNQFLSEGCCDDFEVIDIEEENMTVISTKQGNCIDRNY